jgi:hypothetical protein
MTEPRIVSRTLPVRDELMQNPLALSLWLGVALYAAIGLFGVIVFHDAGPFMPDTTGYGITVSSAAVAPQGSK